MVLLESIRIPLGSPARPFSLPASDGNIYSLEGFSEAKILVLVFMCNHCPYVQAVWGRLVALQESYKERGVQFVGINPNVANNTYEEETMAKMKEYFSEYQMNFPYLADENQEIAKAYKAQCTPDLYVFDAERKLAYHGRIDDNWKDESAVSKRELAEALDALLKGERPTAEQRPCIGCSIKWLE